MGWALVLSFCISACGGGNGRSTAAGTSTSTPTAAAQCSALSGLVVPESAIGVPTSGATVTSATLVETDGEYCQVNGAISPVDTTAPEINFQVNLPTNWNHKALHYGGGGFDGTLVTGVDSLDMAPAGTPTPLASGYATFGDDSGHQSASITDGKFAANDESLANYGGLSLKKTHDVAMLLIGKRYASAPSKTYFFGSSTGGRDGLSEAQRWPRRL